MKNIYKIIFVILIIICLYSLFISGLNTINGLIIDKNLLEVDRDLYQIRCQDYEIQITSLQNELDKAKEALKENNYLGEFEITYYTAGFESTGKTPSHPEYGITKSGTTVEEGRTIAADINVLPIGTKVYIENLGIRVVEDTGSAIVDKDIDVFVESVEVALKNGRHMASIYVIEWGEI